MPIRQAENTQIALIQLSMTNLQKDVTDIKGDLKEIRNNKYVTQNDLQLALQEQMKDVTSQLSTSIEKQNSQLSAIADKVNLQNKIFSIIGGAILLAIVGAILKLVLKV